LRQSFILFGEVFEGCVGKSTALIQMFAGSPVASNARILKTGPVGFLFFKKLKFFRTNQGHRSAGGGLP
jgi:hypothetical protein